jgi:hypothetical protein
MAPATAPATSRPLSIGQRRRIIEFFFRIAFIFFDLALRATEPAWRAPSAAAAVATANGANLVIVDSQPSDAVRRIMVAVGVRYARAAYARGPTVAPTPDAAWVAARIR